MVVLEGGKEEEDTEDSESVEPPLNDADSYAGASYEDEESDEESENLA